MEMFGFGADRIRMAQFGPHKGTERSVNQYALHLQCAWRICDPEGIFIGWSDLFERSSASAHVPEAVWDWRPSGANMRDEKLSEWLYDRSYVVESVAADPYGGFELTLAEGYVLQVFVDSSVGECWRLLMFDEDEHLVVTGQGIED